MLDALQRRWQHRFTDWVLRHHPPQADSIRIHRRRIYILPTRYGYYYAVVLLLMLIGAMNYQNSLSYMLTFLLVGVGSNAMWHTHRNLLDITTRLKPLNDYFADQTGSIDLHLLNEKSRPRWDIVAEYEEGRSVRGNIEADGSLTLHLPVNCPRRGVFPLKRIRVFSRFPLGLFQAWTWLNFDRDLVVYPQPKDSAQAFPHTADDQADGLTTGTGNDDFSSLRDYQDSDSPKHVAWKHLARSEQWLTKEFEGEAGGEVMLDWQAIHSQDPEERLSILCGWVLKADREGIRYGLQLPNQQLPIDHGSQHRQTCLEALARFS